MDKQKERELKLEIQMDDEVANGQYINMAVVNHNDSEFVIDCIYVQPPQAPKARFNHELSRHHAMQSVCWLHCRIILRIMRINSVRLRWLQMKTGRYSIPPQCID